MIRQYIMAAALISIVSLTGCYETSQPVGDTLSGGLITYNDFYRTNRITGTIKHCRHITWVIEDISPRTIGTKGTTDYASWCRTVDGDWVVSNSGTLRK